MTRTRQPKALSLPRVRKFSNVPVWLYVRMRDPEQKCTGGWRYVEEEIGSLWVERTVYFDRAIKPPRVVLHGPSGTERLRG